jgi:hypothetical protein
VLYREGSVQPIQENYTQKAKDYIKINRRFNQKLGDMTEQDAKAEGLDSLAEFKKEWEKISQEPWNPERVVTVYDFDYLPPGSRTGKLLSVGELRQS